MGAGKSTVGPLLAAELGFQFIDADQHLEQKAGLSVAEIFETHGEHVFRRMEADTIRELIALRQIVVALGGGALEAHSTRSLLKDAPNTCIVFLEAPPETLLSRCEEPSASGDRPVRPLLAALREDLPRFKEKLAARLEHYRAAHLTVATADQTPAQVTQAIISRLPEIQMTGVAGERPKQEGIW